MDTAEATQAPVAEHDVPEQESETVEAQSSEEPKTFDAEYVGKLRSEAAKYRTQAKDLAEKAKAYDEYVESQKSEQEKIADELQRAQTEKAQAQQELLRMKVAASKNLPASLVERLRGDTVEELEQDADSLLTELKSQYVEKAAPTPNQTGAGVVGDSQEATVDTFLEILRNRG